MLSDHSIVNTNHDNPPWPLVTTAISPFVPLDKEREVMDLMKTARPSVATSSYDGLVVGRSATD